MSVTSGFFNSLNGDRRYNASQMSSIFDGVINDGVFANIGTAFEVKASEGNTINVGIGRAWFNSAWLLNDSILPIDLDASEVLLDRYDAVVIEIDHSDAVREGSIKVVKGTPASTPSYPTLVHNAYVNQYPLAYILRKAESSSVIQANITNTIGTDVCPYITGILQVQSIEKNVAQWQAQWEEWYASHKASAGEEVSKMLSDLRIMLDATSEDIANWKVEQEAEIETWFESVRGMLEGDAAANLASEIAILQSDVSKKVNRSGDTMTNQLGFKKVENGYGLITKDHTATADYGTRIVDVDANGKTVQLVVQASGDTIAVAIDGKLYKLYGEHNKQHPDYEYSPFDLTAGQSELEDGKLYFVYE